MYVHTYILLDLVNLDLRVDFNYILFKIKQNIKQI